MCNVRPLEDPVRLVNWSWASTASTDWQELRVFATRTDWHQRWELARSPVGTLSCCRVEVEGSLGQPPVAVGPSRVGWEKDPPPSVSPSSMESRWSRAQRPEPFAGARGCVACATRSRRRVALHDRGDQEHLLRRHSLAPFCGRKRSGRSSAETQDTISSIAASHRLEGQP